MGLIGKRVRSFPSKFGDAVDVGLKDVVNEREGITREGNLNPLVTHLFGPGRESKNGSVVD